MERTPNNQDEKKGIECPRCGCRHFYTDKTRPMAKFILRYRHCRNCGCKVRTREKIA